MRVSRCAEHDPETRGRFLLGWGGLTARQPIGLCVCGHTWAEHQPRGGANESEHCRALGGCAAGCRQFTPAEERTT